MTPDLGQGACQAIEDALELAMWLGAKFDKMGGLKNYEASRIPRTSSIVLSSRRMGRIGQINSTVLCRVRDAAMGLVPRALTLRSLAPIVGYEGHLKD
jgi:2-polyprenyl-6-methoxyphenol hydroxylase-like FAD-dependent oxidoreductase